jgi:hypothetical protein
MIYFFFSSLSLSLSFFKKKPLNNLAALQKKLRKFILEDEEWEIIEQTLTILEAFDLATTEIANENITLNRAISVYNFLFDKIEDHLDTLPKNFPELIKGLEEARQKLSHYYSKTTAPSYNVAIGKLFSFSFSFSFY